MSDINNNKIPKIIHYCWLSGDPYPEKIEKCMASWKEKLPDYKFILWDTKKFNVNICDYTREAFEAKKYAFVCDYVRLYALYNYGGIYMDTDIEVLKPIDDLLDCEAFTCISSDPTSLQAVFMGARQGHPWIKEIMDSYEGRHFIMEDGSLDMTPIMCVGEVTQKLYHFQTDGKQQDLEDGVRLYPHEVDGAYNFETGELNINDNSYVIHWCAAGWWDEGQRRKYKRRQKMRRILGVKLADDLYIGTQVLKEQGIKMFFIKIRNRILKRK